MISLLCKVIEKIVFSGVDGTILIIPIIILLRVIYGQVLETIELFKEV